MISRQQEGGMTHTARAVVDRVEGTMAVVEIAGVLVDWPLSALPAGVGEGTAWEVSWTPASSSPPMREDPPRPPIIEL
jgi:hypothetical protein